MKHQELTDAEKIVMVRKICCELDSMPLQDPKQWWASVEWMTGWIMGVVKYGEGYENYESRKDIKERVLTRGIDIPPDGVVTIEIPLT